MSWAATQVPETRLAVQRLLNTGFFKALHVDELLVVAMIGLLVSLFGQAERLIVGIGPPLSGLRNKILNPIFETLPTQSRDHARRRPGGCTR